MNRHHRIIEIPMIEPINVDQQATVRTACRHYLDIAGQHFQQAFDDIDIRFDLRGRNAGMYQRNGRLRCIRFNPWIFARYFDAQLAETVPHEIAHYVTDEVYGMRNIRPHGAEWKSLMQYFGVSPRRTFDCDLSGIPQRQYRRYAYRCDCREHALTAIRHNRVLRGTMRYFCRQCGGCLVPMEQEVSVLA